jgi:ferredoxin
MKLLSLCLFGLGLMASQVNAYNVRLIGTDNTSCANLDTTIQCSETEYILDCAENNSISLPYATRAGASLEETGRVLTGTYDNSDQSILGSDAQSYGFVETDTLYATSDLEIKVCQQAALCSLLPDYYCY